MERFAEWVLKHRLFVIMATGVVTVVAVFFLILNTRVESDISKYLPPDDPAVMRFRDTGERFGGVAMALAAVEFPDVFTPEALSLIDRLTRELRTISGVSWVASLTAVDDVQEKTLEGEKTVSVGKLIDAGALESDPAALARLRKYVLGKKQLVGAVVSADGTLAGIACSIQEGADRVEVATAIERKAQEIVGERPFYFTGFPAWMKTMSAMILDDMGRLVPISVIMLILILFASFRSVRGVLLPLATVLLSSVWAMGLMAALDWPITMLSNATPVLCMALGTAYSIHLLHRHDEVGAAQVNDPKCLRRSVVDVLIPILMAGVTTVVGFVSFLTTNLSFIRQFGWISAFGIFAAMLLALTFLPAVLSYLPPRKARPARNGPSSEGLNQGVDRPESWTIRKRTWVVVFWVALCLVALAFIPSIRHRFSMVEYFPPESGVRRADDMMREKLGGNTAIWVSAKGDSKHPFVLKSMWLVEKYLRSVSDVHNQRSIAGLIAEMNEIMTGRLTIPSTREGVGNLWLNLEGKDVLTQLVDREGKQALVQAVSETADTARLRALLFDLDRFLERIPSRVTPVDLRSADPAIYERARAAQLERVAQSIALDLRSEPGGPIFDEAEARGWIEGEIARVAVVSDPESHREWVRGYLLSDESEVEIEDPALAAQLANRLAGQLLVGQRDALNLVETILTGLPDNLRDREQAAALAKSLVLLVEEREGERRVDLLLAAVLKHLPPAIVARPDLLKALKGDLAELNEQIVYLPAGAQAKDVVSITLEQAGMHEIAVHVDDGVVFSQLSSLFLAVIAALVLIMIQFRSVVAGLFGMIPMVFTLLINFGVMGLFGIDLEPATVLIAAVVVGVGVDYPIHFLSRLKIEMGSKGELAPAADRTLGTTGRAILINALAVIGGQLVFLAGELVPLHFFGVLLALAMVVSSLAALTALPVALVAVRPKFLFKRRNN